jgi:hypothetical protein
MFTIIVQANDEGQISLAFQPITMVFDSLKNFTLPSSSREK